MFGYINVNWKEITPEQKKRYGSVYCGVCRRIREQSGNLARLGLQYDPMPACCIPSGNGPGWTATASVMRRT